MKLRLLLLLFPFAVALTSPLWWGLAADFLRPPNGMEETLVPPSSRYQQFAMEGISFTRSIGGRTDSQITAARLTTTEREDELYLEEVHALLQSESGSLLQVTSDRGLYDTRDLVLTLEEQVWVKLDQEHELQTDLLSYREKTGTVETEAPVRLEGPEVEIQGYGMTYDLATGSFAVGGRVRVLIR